MHTLAPVSVVVCAYTMERLELTLACLRAVQDQQPRPAEVVLVIDHNPELRTAMAARTADVAVVENAGPRGLSGARNTGIAASSQPVVAFVDDDAVPQPGWLAGLLRALEDPAVAVTGGAARPAWDGGPPGWFPDEFLWVVGCSYRGQRRGLVRNPLGCSMAFRRQVFNRVGGFDPSVGRLGRVPLGCEETEICLRYRAADPAAKIVLVDDSTVIHQVPRGRRSLRYFLTRCFYEGISKAVVRKLAGGRSLETERGYALGVLLPGTLRALGAALRGPNRVDSLARGVAIPTGLAVTVAGYLVGRVLVWMGRAPGSRPAVAV